MLSILSKFKRHSLLKKMYINQIQYREAVRTINKQSLDNNPFKKNKFRHNEVQRQECDVTNCNTKDCPKICGNPTARKAVAHITHGQSSPNETDKKTYTVSPTDLDGKNKQQNAVVYDNAHNTSATPEHIIGTTKLNNEPMMKAIIIKYEDKK